MDRELESWSLTDCLRYLSGRRASFVFLMASNIIAFVALQSWTIAADGSAVVYDQECLEQKERFSREVESLRTDKGNKHAGDHFSDLVNDTIFNSNESCLKKNPWLLHPAKKEEGAVRELIDKQLQDALNPVKHEP